MLTDLCRHMEKALTAQKLPKPVKSRGFAFLVASPCSSPVNLTRGLCDSVTNPGLLTGS